MKADAGGIQSHDAGIDRGSRYFTCEYRRLVHKPEQIVKGSGDNRPQRLEETELETDRTRGRATEFQHQVNRRV